MSLAEKNLNYCDWDIQNLKKNLKNNFLFLRDNDSLNILLNICNIEQNIHNIFPNYMSLDTLKRDLIKYYGNNFRVKLLSRNISQLIHDDINRFELLVYLDAYILGQNSYRDINKLEIIAIKLLGPENIFLKDKLFSYEQKNPHVLRFKSDILKQIRNDRNIRLKIYKLVRDLDRKLIKSKLKKLNSHIDVQLSIDKYDPQINKDRFSLSGDEIKTVNRKILKFMYRDGYRVFSDAYWCGLNDAVIRRYR